MSSGAELNRYWLVFIGVVALLSLAYGVLVLERILLGLIPIVLVLALYVGWRALRKE